MFAELAMKAIAPPTDLTGSYLITLTAAAECSAMLPETARSRTYPASIIRGEAEERFTGTLLVPPGKNMTFNAAVAATSATLWFGNAEFDVPGVLEDLGTGSLYIAGEARALASTGRIAGAMQGDWIYCPREAVGRTSLGPLGCPRSAAQYCLSFGHQMVLTAR